MSVWVIGRRCRHLRIGYTRCGRSGCHHAEQAWWWRRRCLESGMECIYQPLFWVLPLLVRGRFGCFGFNRQGPLRPWLRNSLGDKCLSCTKVFLIGQACRTVGGCAFRVHSLRRSCRASQRVWRPSVTSLCFSRREGGGAINPPLCSARCC